MNTKPKKVTKVTRVEKSIDKVTTSNLNSALLLCDIRLSMDIVDHIIDIVELLEDKGDQTTLKDITKLKEEWL